MCEKRKEEGAQTKSELVKEKRRIVMQNSKVARIILMVFLYQSEGGLGMENPHLHQNRIDWLNLYMRNSLGDLSTQGQKKEIGGPTHKKVGGQVHERRTMEKELMMGRI